MTKVRDLMKKISGVDREERVYLKALWTLFLELEEAIENGHHKKGKEYIRTSLRILNEFEMFILLKSIDFYEPSEAFKLGKEFMLYKRLLVSLGRKLIEETEPKFDLRLAHNALSTITGVILCE